MEQKDYILKEIEKIGLVLRAILGILMGKSGKFAITLQNHFEKTNEQLIHEIGFDLQYFLTLDESGINNYLTRFKGINTTNLELLADVLFWSGKNENPGNSKVFLEKALHLYLLCEIEDKTYSFERKAKIKWIMNVLQQN